MATFNPTEKAYYDQLFDIVDKDQSGVLAGQDALPFLTSSNLSQQTLGEVWAIADPSNNGFLTKDGWYKAARVIGWLQKGGQSTVQDSLATRPGPLPTFSGHPPPPTIQTNRPSSAGAASLPPLTPADRTKFTRIFVSCGPQNGLVSGDKAREVFLKSQLNYDKLGQIWNLADTQQRGTLDLTDFIIAMYLIQSCMANPSLDLPTTLPPGTYEQASGGRPPSRAAPPAVPISRQHTGGSTSSPVRAQHTGASLQQQLTGQHTGGIPPPRSSTLSSLPSSSSFANAGQATQGWDVTAEEKVNSDRFFAQLDSQNQGVIEGDVVVPFMLQSQLDEGSLASIWDLVDIRHEGKLDRDEFAVALHLINAKLAGRDIPTTLPTSLVPPSLRSVVSAGGQETLSGPSSVTKDLFDLFDDEPTPSTPIASNAGSPQAARAPPATVAFLPQPPSRRSTGQAPRQAASPAPTSPAPPAVAANFAPPSDLLGDDSATSTSVPESSADIGNKRNQLSTTTQNLDKLQQTRGDLEKSTEGTQDELSRLETDLSNARVRHEAESKAVAELRSRLAEQTAKMKDLRAEVISAESDLSGMRSEKDELEQALLRDKEEVRSLQKRMKEVNDEKATLKTLLEKMRKEARQQKGMVSIAKKQVITAETSRDGVQKEIDEHAAGSSEIDEAAAVALPVTPKAMSPSMTGTSQRSNNPFDRLGASRSGRSSPSVPDSRKSIDKVEAGGKDSASAALTASEMTRQASTGSAGSADVAAPEGNVPAAIGQDRNAENAEELGGNEAEEMDPFGAPADGPPSIPGGFKGFDDFDTSTAAAKQGQSEPDEKAERPAKAVSDFDTAFADFDEPSADTEDVAADSPTKTDIASDVPAPPMLSENLLNEGIAQSPEKLPEQDRLPEPGSATEAPPTLTSAPLEDADSSDEDEGPEDLEASKPKYGAKPPERATTPLAVTAEPLSPSLNLAEPLSAETTKTRRSAPAPPSREATKEPATMTQITEMSQIEPSTETTARGPKMASFDDEDFDFTDQPPSTMDDGLAGPQSHSKAFDDEFATFDDEFESKSSSQPNTGSDNSNSLAKSYEIVSPQSGPSEGVQPTPKIKPTDEWGMASDIPKNNAPPLSFDDAFGGAFEPSPAPFAPEPANNAGQSSYAPPAGNSPGLQPPAPPQRRPTDAQADDLEDVKKLCAMGFSRSLVVEALGANGYDFQKALNVLLVQ